MNKKGVTLIELMIVVAILGILVAIAMPRVSLLDAYPKLVRDGYSKQEINKCVSEYEIYTYRKLSKKLKDLKYEDRYRKTFGSDAPREYSEPSDRKAVVVEINGMKLSIEVLEN